MFELMITVMALVGSLVGLVSSFFGVGACFIMVPVMMYCFETFMNAPPYISPLLAFGTNMAIVVPTALSGVLRHKKELKRKGAHFPTKHYLSFAVPVGFGSLTGAIFAFIFFTSFRAYAGIILKTIFGVFCLIGAYRFMKAKPIPISKISKVSIPKFAGSGYLSGILAHFIGIGGGIVYMPVLNTILRIPVHIAVSVSLATMVIGSSIGSLSFIILGYLDQLRHPLDYPSFSFGWFNLIAFLGIGIASVIFAQIGPRLAHRTTPSRFKMLLAIVYAYIGVRLVTNGVLQLLGMPSIIP